MGRTGCSEKLPEHWKASVDGIEILMHGRRDAVSLDGRASHREIFGISNERCGRGGSSLARSGFSMSPMRFLEDRWRLILARYPDSLLASLELPPLAGTLLRLFSAENKLAILVDRM